MTGAEFGGVDIDLLADYIGGALEGLPEESAVAARIATDPVWQTAYESLSADMALVSTELGRFEVEPMPADLAAQLDAAFADEPEPLRLVVTDGAAVSDSIPKTAFEPVRGNASQPVRKKAGLRRGWVTPIAVAAGLIAFVGFGADYLHGLSSHSNADATSSSGSAQSDSKLPATAPLQGSQVQAGQILNSGVNYTAVTLATEPMHSMTAHHDMPELSGGESVLERLATPAALSACLAAVEKANGADDFSVESVDFARFSGSPALVIRFSAANGRWAWASGPACGTPAGGAAKLAQVPVG